MKIAWKLLVVLGVLVMWWALALDTSVESPGLGSGRVHNLSLASEQSNFLFLGAVLFIAGILIFAVVKLKQTKDDETSDVALAQVKSAQLRQATTETLSRVASQLGQAGSKAETRTLVRRAAAALRTTVAIILMIFGALTALIGDYALVIGGLIMLLAVWLLIRSREIGKAAQKQELQ